MAHAQLDGRPPVKAASAIPANALISFLPAASALAETVWRASQLSDFPIGVTSATVATAGDPVSYWRIGDVAKCIALASVGAGAFVGLSQAGTVSVGPLTPSNIASSANGSGLRFVIGYTLKSGAAGDVIPVFVSPTQLI
jgi:hypothetical protein